jgi:hypothetical protein
VVAISIVAMRSRSPTSLAIAMLGGYSYWSLKTGEYGWYASTAAAAGIWYTFNSQ